MTPMSNQRHKGFPLPKKTAVETLYENRLHLQKQSQQYQSNMGSQSRSGANRQSNQQHS